jgi:hypothetical protein
MSDYKTSRRELLRLSTVGAGAMLLGGQTFCVRRAAV